MVELTDRQKAILQFISNFISENAMPPTVREISEEFNFKSPKATQDHLAALDRKGYIHRDIGKARGIRIIDKKYAPKETDLGIPILGSVAAGPTILAEENLTGYFNFREIYGKIKNLFALKVRGDSMIYASINDGDFVIVKNIKSLNNGDIGVAVLNGEATVKRMFFERDKVTLQPENRNYEPVVVDLEKDEFEIAGKVVGVHRVF